MKKRIGLILFLFLNLAPGWAQVVIHGKAPGYAGQELTLKHYSNMISYSEDTIASCRVGEDEQYEFSFDADKIHYVFINSGVYFMFFYAEPGFEYRLNLPPYLEKTEQEKMNPYFQERLRHLTPKEKIPMHQEADSNMDRTSELNLIIRIFDNTYYPYYYKHAVDVYVQENVDELEHSIEKIEEAFGEFKHPYFLVYKKYKIGMLRILSMQKKATAISDEYFKDQPVLYDHPAYMELFNQVYDQYFVFYSRGDMGEKLIETINVHQDYQELKSILLKDKVLDDRLAELVILKSIYDGFYRDPFYRSALLNILDSLSANTVYPKHQSIAADIREKITELLVGFEPPSFELYDLDSNLVRLSDFKGEYVYLGFCNVSGYTCLKEMQLLQDMHKRLGDRIELITVSVDEDIAQLRDYIKANDFQWTILHYGHQPGILNDYDIRAFPTYFLIDPEGKLLQSPAPSLSENFESRLFEILKSQEDR